jgi:uncharacterized protein YcfJ
MIRLLTLVGATVGGWLGWKIGAPIGLGTAWLLSAFGSFAGVYVGWRLARELMS